MDQPNEQKPLSDEEKAYNTFIGEHQPNDGREWEPQCARCGSSVYSEECDACGGEGITGPGELYEQDPLWYDEYDYENCGQCDGKAVWLICMSTPEWCNAHPLHGEETKRGQIEWYTFDKLKEPV